MYYKQNGEDRWRNSARVIGKDGKINILRHGGQMVRAHICRVKGVVDQSDSTVNDMNEDKKDRDTNETVHQFNQSQNDE